MRAIVAGGAGFVGSHLCDHLLLEGWSVTCVDNLVTGSLKNIEHLLGSADFTFIQHDVTRPLDAHADAIFHLASPASPNPLSRKSYLVHPVETALVNSQGTHQLLEAARLMGAKFLFASTSEIYGEPKEHPQRESYWGNVNPTGVRACYDESKRFGEALTMTYIRQFQTDARIVRIFNTYGPRCDPADGRVIPTFITQALAGQDMTVFGDGSQTRSLCYVSDLVNGIWQAMTIPTTSGEIFNLGNPEEHTILEYANFIRNLCKSNSEIVFRPLPPDDPTRRRPDIGKARAHLGWQPRVGLQEGLTQSIAWHRVHSAQPELAP